MKESIFLKACRREKTTHTPVWLMRQAGRYMKDYRAIREKTPFLEICKNKDLVTEITVTAQAKIKADAAILFADILLIVEPFGFSLEYLKGDGPTLKNAIRTASDAERLPEANVSGALAYVFDAVRQTRSALPKNIPLIGFAGAPFTLASYMIEGGASKDFAQTKKFMRADGGQPWNLLMDKIARATREYLNAQIQAGAEAVQLFDSWVGCLTGEEYGQYVFPHTKKVIENLDPGAPVIHFGTGTAPFLELVRDAGGDVIGVDHRIALDEAWRRIGPTRAIQGNLDPKILLGPLSEIKKEVKKILEFAGGRPGHIFNLGHGVLPQTPVENVMALVEMVHEF